MKSFFYTLALAVFLVGCGGGNELDSKKETLKTKQKELEKLESEIAKLKTEIAKADPKYFKGNERVISVTAVPAKVQNFAHYIEARGVVESDQNVTLSAKTMGIVTAVYVTEGQRVGQGTILLSQDADIIQSNIAQLRTQLELATTVYEKQKRLWEQKIGTEIQYLQAKNNKEALEKNIAALQTQAAQSVLVAPFSGIVDEVYAKQGEMGSPSTPAIRLVSLSNVKVNADIPEAYLGKLNKGDSVIVNFPSLKEERKVRINNIGQVINPNNRTFQIEMNLDNKDGKIKPEMLAVVKLKDAEIPNAVTIPSNLIQQDVSGDYVFVIDPKTSLVKRVGIKAGESYKNEVVIKEGLKGDETLVNEGYRLVSEGNKVKVKEAVTNS